MNQDFNSATTFFAIIDNQMSIGDGMTCDNEDMYYTPSDSFLERLKEDYPRVRIKASRKPFMLSYKSSIASTIGIFSTPSTNRTEYTHLEEVLKNTSSVNANLLLSDTDVLQFNYDGSSTSISMHFNPNIPGFSFTKDDENSPKTYIGYFLLEGIDDNVNEVNIQIYVNASTLITGTTLYKSSDDRFKLTSYIECEPGQLYIFKLTSIDGNEITTVRTLHTYMLPFHNVTGFDHNEVFISKPILVPNQDAIIEVEENTSNEESTWKGLIYALGTEAVEMSYVIYLNQIVFFTGSIHMLYEMFIILQTVELQQFIYDIGNIYIADVFHLTNAGNEFLGRIRLTPVDDSGNLVNPNGINNSDGKFTCLKFNTDPSNTDAEVFNSVYINRFQQDNTAQISIRLWHRSVNHPSIQIVAREIRLKLTRVDGFAVQSEGIVNLAPDRYLRIRCSEIENHLRGSYDNGSMTPGMGVINMDVQGFANRRTEFFSVNYKRFHPIGLLSRLRFQFERGNAEHLYDFKGVDLHFLLSIRYLAPIQKRGEVMLKSTPLNPDYNANFQQYVWNSIRNYDYDDDTQDSESVTSSDQD